MGHIDWGLTIGWGVIVSLGIVAVRLQRNGFRAYTCSRCGGYRRSVTRVTKENGHEVYACGVCGAGYVREPGRKLVPYAQWKAGDGLPRARLVSKPEPKRRDGDL